MADGTGLAKVHRDVGARSLFVEMQVNGGFVGLDQAGVGNRPVGVGGVLIVGQDLLSAELGLVKGEFVHAAEVRVQAGPRGVVVVADSQGRIAEGGDGGIIAAGVGDVARLGAVGAASPGLGDSLFAIDVHGDGGVHHLLRIIDHHDVGPLTKHVGHTAENIQTGAAARAAEHTEVPADAFAAGIVGVGLALEEHPSLPVYARIRVTIIDRALAVAGLVARRIEPRLNGERFVVLGVHRGVPGDFSAGGEIEEGGSARVAQDRAGHGMDSAQVLECCDSGGDARVEMVGAAHRAVAQAIVGSGSVGENRLRVVGRHCRGGQGGEASSSNAPNRSSDQVFHKEHLRYSQTRLRSGSVLSLGIGLLPDC